MKLISTNVYVCGYKELMMKNPYEMKAKLIYTIFTNDPCSHFPLCK